MGVFSIGQCLAGDYLCHLMIELHSALIQLNLYPSSSPPHCLKLDLTLENVQWDSFGKQLCHSLSFVATLGWVSQALLVVDKFVCRV